jgi:hypothetical protein
LVGKRSGRVLGIGLQIEVLIAAADIERNDIVLGLVPPNKRKFDEPEPGTKRHSRKVVSKAAKPPPAKKPLNPKREARLAKQAMKREERKKRRQERIKKEKRKRTL